MEVAESNLCSDFYLKNHVFEKRGYVAAAVLFDL